VTKLFTTTAFMTLVRDGAVALDDPVSSVLGEFSGRRPIQAYENPLVPGSFVEVAQAKEGASVDAVASVDAGEVCFRDLLCHSSGLPAWRPLYRQESKEAALRMVTGTFFSYPRRARVVYSDLGLILVGLAVQKLSGMPLDKAVGMRVLEPLGLARTRYFPAPADASAIAALDIAPTEICAWRKRRIQGEVHDENAASLGGVAGHAGLFSTAAELARLGQCYLDGGSPLLGAGTVSEMTSLQSQDGAVRRGVGFALWSPDPEASSNPLGPRAFGHLGFTGTSLWVDPDLSLVVACLTNRVYFGRDAAGIGAFRVALHKSVAEAAALRSW
jgi:serine-type D-Ala-D-Ala carboxypeptidase